MCVCVSLRWRWQRRRRRSWVRVTSNRRFLMRIIMLINIVCSQLNYSRFYICIKVSKWHVFCIPTCTIMIIPNIFINGRCGERERARECDWCPCNEHRMKTTSVFHSVRNDLIYLSFYFWFSHCNFSYVLRQPKSHAHCHSRCTYWVRCVIA